LILYFKTCMNSLTTIEGEKKRIFFRISIENFFSLNQEMHRKPFVFISFFCINRKIICSVSNQKYFFILSPVDFSVSLYIPLNQIKSNKSNLRIDYLRLLQEIFYHFRLVNHLKRPLSKVETYVMAACLTSVN
jgi:hypothetical protein